jgi:hypothetical protein
MKLYLVHVGFYDIEVFDGVYESHGNFFVVANDFEEARTKAKLNPIYKSKKMHVDGLQEVTAVEGFAIKVQVDKALNGETRVVGHRHRDLAPKTVSN